MATLKFLGSEELRNKPKQHKKIKRTKSFNQLSLILNIILISYIILTNITN